MSEIQTITKEKANEIWLLLNQVLFGLPPLYGRLDLVILHHACSLLELLASSLSDVDRETATRQLISTRFAIRRAALSLTGKPKPQPLVTDAVWEFADHLAQIESEQ